MSITYLHDQKLSIYLKNLSGDLDFTWSDFCFSRFVVVVKFISPLCFSSQLIPFVGGFILGPGDNIQKSKTLIETTPTVFSGLIKDDFVCKNFLYLSLIHI